MSKLKCSHRQRAACGPLKNRLRAAQKPHMDQIRTGFLSGLNRLLGCLQPTFERLLTDFGAGYNGLEQKAYKRENKKMSSQRPNSSVECTPRITIKTYLSCTCS